MITALKVISTTGHFLPWIPRNPQISYFSVYLNICTCRPSYHRYHFYPADNVGTTYIDIETTSCVYGISWGECHWYCKSTRVLLPLSVKLLKKINSATFRRITLVFLASYLPLFIIRTNSGYKNTKTLCPSSLGMEINMTCFVVESWEYFLTQFRPMFLSYTPWKTKKSKFFLCFQGLTRFWKIKVNVL